MLDVEPAGCSVRNSVLLPTDFFDQAVEVHRVARTLKCDASDLKLLADFAGISYKDQWDATLKVRDLLRLHFVLMFVATGNTTGWSKQAQFELLICLGYDLSVSNGQTAVIDLDLLCQEFVEDTDDEHLEHSNFLVAQKLRYSLTWVQRIVRQA